MPINIPVRTNITTHLLLSVLRLIHGLAQRTALTVKS
jgi:hypothetical protein